MGTGNLDADPLFLNAANGDFSLRYDSPAIDTGTDTGAPVDDIVGNPRPVDIPGVGNEVTNTVDMGAFEMPLVVYVDRDNVGAEDGQTWATAWNTVQEGIDASFAAGGGEVWVAEGVYGEARVSVNADESGVDTGSVVMKANVHLYGGFVGTETARSQRDFNLRVTTLDGAISRGGSPAYHVVVGANNATLDGFTVTGGNANGPGMSVFGGGMFNSSSSPTLTNCTFSGNSASSGGGMYNTGSSPIVANCTFSGNSTTNRGGGMYNVSSSSTVTNCAFSDNSTNILGGGMLNTGSSPTVTNCTFSRNSASGGGGMANQNLASPIVTNCTFSENSAIAAGGGMYNIASSSPTVTNSILFGDTPDEVGDVDTSTSAITFSIVQGGFTGTGNINADPLFVDALNGDLRLRSLSPAIDTGTSVGAPSTDIDGVLRPQGAGVDMGAYEFNIATPQDADGDGLPDVDEAGQGLNDLVADAALFATLDFPSANASLQTAPIVLSGRISSAFIDAVVVSTDGGTTFDKVATITGLTWSLSWTPSIGSHNVVIKAGNTFGGFTTTAPRTVFYRPGNPEAVITSPVGGLHLQGTVPILGTAKPPAGFGLQNYLLEFNTGSDPNAPTGWTTLINSVSSVDAGTLFSGWDVSGLTDGPYILRLTVTDNGFFSSTTNTVVEVDSDVIAPVAPSITITGGTLAGVVATGDAVNVTGTAEAGSTVLLAEVLDDQGLAIQDVTAALTIHLNGSLRGSFTLADVSATDSISLRVSVQDPVGNAGPFGASNGLLVDVLAPTVGITFPLNTATLPLSQIVVTGTASDNGVSGLSLVEVSTDGGATYAPATGTANWSFSFTPGSTGALTLTARATDALGNQGTASVNVTINSAFPTAFITSPASGAEINVGEVLNILGTASDSSDFDFYAVQIIPPSGIPLTIFGPINTPVVNGALVSAWDTGAAGLDQGTSTLRLIASDLAANRVTFDMPVLVRANLSLAAVPDATVPEDGAIANHAHLPTFASAVTGDPETFAYSIVSVSDAAAGVTLDVGNNIDITPNPNFFGTASVTVRVDNGALTNDDTFLVNVLPVNDAPTQPVVVIAPAQPADNENLAATVTTPSLDVEGAVITYTYQWFELSGGAPLLVRTQVTTSTTDTLPSANTIAGNTYQCLVTPNDGVVDGPAALDSVLVRQPATISASLSSSQIRLGESVTISGAMSATDGTVVGVSFTSTRPSGVVDPNFPEATNTGTTSYTRLFFPDEASGGQPDWSIMAAFAGDSQFAPAISAPVALTVTQPQPALAITLSDTSAPKNFANLSVTVTMTAGLPAQLATLLSGRTLELSVRKPDATFFPTFSVVTDAGGVATFTPAILSANGVAFANPGTYQFQAHFPGNANFVEAFSANFGTPQAPRLTIKDGAGYAVLVVGALDNSFPNLDGTPGLLGEGQAEHTKTMDFVYQTMIDRGIAPADILYFREDIGGPTPASLGITVFDTTPTKAEVQSAIEVTARDKMNSSPGPLYIVMIDHGLEDEFFLFSGSFAPAQRILTPFEFDGYLDTLQGGLSGIAGDATPGEAADQEIVVVAGFCHSGSFIDAVDGGAPTVPLVSGPNRTIISSSKRAEISHRGPLSPGVTIRDGELFVTELFRGLAQGVNLKEAFEEASRRIADFTLSRSNTANALADIPQEPLLDDTGDGIGAVSSALSFDVGMDGARAFETTLGFGTNSVSMTVGLFTATPNSILTPTDPLPQLFTDTTESGVTGNEAWIEVKAPSYTQAAVAATGFVLDDLGQPLEDLADFQQVVQLPAFDSDVFDPADGTYTWSASTLDRTGAVTLGQQFQTAGTYKVYYFVRDAGTGEVSAQLVTTIRRQLAGNLAPSAVTPLVPANGATLSGSVTFGWSQSTDPEGDALDYRLEIDTVPTFDSPDLLIRDNLIATFEQVSGLQDAQTYSWRVTAVDEFGNQSPLSQVFSVSIDNFGNPCIGGAILVNVTSSSTGAAITDATVQVFDGAKTVTGVFMGAGVGYLLTDVQCGTHTLDVSAPSFTTLQIVNGVTAPSNVDEVFQKPVALAPGGGVDTDGDGLTDADEINIYFTNPNNPDTDGDGFFDGMEIDAGTDPNLASSNTPLNPVFVQTGYAGVKKGTTLEPVATLREAETIVVTNGIVTFQNTGIANETGIFNKAMRIQAGAGSIAIGGTP